MEMGDFIKEHKALFFGGIIVGLVVVSLGVTVISGAIFNRGGSETAQEEQGERFDKEESEEKEARDLTKAQLAYQKDYSDAEDKVIAQLAAATWVSNDSAGTLEIDEDGFYTETLPADGSEVEKNAGSLAIASIDGSPMYEDQNGTKDDTDFVIVDADGDYHIAHLQKVLPADESKDPYYMLKSDAFIGENGYTTEYEWKGLEVKGIGEEVEDAIGRNGAKELETKLKEYAQANHATCFEATWDQLIVYDYATDSVTTSFTYTSSTLDDQGANETYQVNVEYMRGTKEFTITEVTD